MNKFFTLILCLATITLFGQVNYTANDLLNSYNGPYRAGANPGYYGPNWDDFYLSDLAAGNPTSNQLGAGIRAFRTVLPEFIALQYEYKSWEPVYEYYESLGITDNTLVVGIAAAQHADPVQYCPGVQTQMFANLYEPIWDGGANGTAVNENNYFAKYMVDLVNTVGDQVKFWEIWNEPGFDYTGAKGWLQPGQPGNWWENNPEPCDYKLQAPIFNYIRTMRIAYEVVKTMSPDDYIVLSGVGYESFLDAILRNTDNPNNGAVNGDFPLTGGAYFDVMGFHNYPHFDGSVREWNNAIGGFEYFRHSDGAVEGVSKKMDLRYDLLASYGYNGNTYPEKLWTITEIHVPRKAFSEGFGSDIAQRNYAIKTVENAIRSNIIQTHFWALAERDYINDADDEFDVMGFYQKLNDIEPFQQTINESGIAYKTASDLLFDRNFDDNVTLAMNLPNGVKGGAYQNSQGKYIYVLWAETLTDQSETAFANYTFPSGIVSGNMVKRAWDHSYNGTETMISSQNIALTGTPIFLTAAIEEVGTITLNCPADAIYELPVTQNEGGAIQNIPVPTATTTCPQGGVTVTQVSGLGSGSFFPFGTTIVSYKATDACGNEAFCALSVRVASTGGGLGDCHPNRWDFNYRGTYNGNKYFQSKFDVTYQQAVASATSHGGRLVVINDAAENQFIQNNMSATAYIGLSDAQSEGNLAWADGSTLGYTNYDNCSWCEGNTSNNDFVEFHPWNGQWSFNDGTALMPFIMELPCGEVSDCNCATVYDPVCGANGITYPNSCEAQCAGVFTFTNGECLTGGDCPSNLSGHDFLGEYNGHKYFISQNSETWLNAKDIAGANGGYLVAFENAGENDFVKNNINEIVFTGFNDRGAEGIYTWVSNDQVGYLNISGINSAQNDYGNMNFWDGSWGFDNQWVQRKYIVELPCSSGGGCNSVGQSCDDNNPCTTNDVIDSACNCNGTPLNCATGPTTTIACNDNNPNTTNDVVTTLNCDGSVCVPCAGTPVNGGGDCPNSVAGFSALGEYNNHKYFISINIARPADLQAMAVAAGGYLAVVNDVNENNFLFNNVNDMVYIGLNDVSSEGSLSWVSGDTYNYNNIDVCSFCQSNDASNDYVVMHSWDGKWSFSNEWNQRLGVIEIPCGGVEECICTTEIVPVCGNNGVTYSNPCLAECDGVFNYTSGECGGSGNNCVDNIPGFQLIATNGASNYYLSNDNARPGDAQVIAEANGGYLASISTQAENDLIHNNLSTLAYIGFNDEQTEGTLQWVNGQPVNFTNWDICDFCVPNSNTDDYVIMHSWNGGWSFSNTWNQRPFVMEIPCTFNTPNLSPIKEDQITIENIFPNPASEEIFIKIESINEVTTSLHIYDVSGKIVLSKKVDLEPGFNYLEVDIASFASGIYQLHLVDENGQMKYQNFVKQRD